MSSEPSPIHFGEFDVEVLEREAYIEDDEPILGLIADAETDPYADGKLPDEAQQRRVHSREDCGICSKAKPQG